LEVGNQALNLLILHQRNPPIFSIPSNRTGKSKRISAAKRRQGSVGQPLATEIQELSSLLQDSYGFLIPAK
jgi:hypothetical protein